MSTIEMVFSGFVIGVVLLCMYSLARGGASCGRCAKTETLGHIKEPRDEPKNKDRVRTIIICGNCGAPYHVPELTREIEIECSCGKKYAPWKEIEP